MENSQQKQAEAIIREGVEESVKAGLLPVPFMDLYLVLKEQMKMLKKLCDLYGAPYSKVKTEALITSVISGGILWRFGGSMAKFVPLTGWVMGMATMSIVSGASTYAIGRLAVRYLEEEGTLENAGGEKAKEMYEEAMEEGKEMATDIKEEMEKEVTEEVQENVETQSEEAKMMIEKLQQLKDAGILTEKEFESKKKKVEKLMGNED
ncbi:MAG: DUF697 domain-containing protein [Bacteroidota bacterium]